MKINYRKTGTLTKAGLAFIEYDDSAKKPKRVKDKIILPPNGFEMYQVDEAFSQFLYLSAETNNNNYPVSCWFGGTDEMPFLVQLTSYKWKEYWAKDNFYEEIKPKIIRTFEEIYGPNTKRQGDIFAYELPKEFQDIKKVSAMLMIADDHEGYLSQYSRRLLFGTRHALEGEIETRWKHPIARGIVRAPDHKDLILDKLHILAQTRGLYEPEKAD